jgi:hypothetical protein
MINFVRPAGPTSAEGNIYVTDALPRNNGGLNRRSLLRNGLAVGLGVSAIGAASASLAGVANAAAANPQPNWWWCTDCDGLFFSNSSGASNGFCQSAIAQSNNDGRHNSSGSSNYSVYNGVSASSTLQTGWAWCNVCQLLFYGPGVAGSACPAQTEISGGKIVVGPHTIGSGTKYDLLHGITGSPYQVNWRWCNLCEGIFWGPDRADSWCTGQLRNGESGAHVFGSGTSYDMLIT